MDNYLRTIGGLPTDREQNDFYATEPKAVEWLLKLETFDKNIWDCAAGQNHIAIVLKQNGYNVRTSDLIVREEGIEQLDFLKNNEKWDGDLITNPPYKFATDFIYKALETIKEGHKIAMFLKLQFLEGKRRKKLFLKYPPKTIYVSSSRLNCAKSGAFESHPSSAVAYCWYIWQKGFRGNTLLKWFN